MKIPGFFIAIAVICGYGAFARAEDVVISTMSVEISTPTAVVEPFVWPVSRKVGGVPVVIVSKFGKRKVPASDVFEMHEGVDFGVSPGASVKAARSGKVLFAGFSKEYSQRADKKQQNRLVIVRHVDGTSSRYVHLATLKIRASQEVTAGDLLGTVDRSDEVSMPVLHFEIRNATGKPLDPGAIFANEGLIP